MYNKDITNYLNKKILIIYYSLTGNSEKIAFLIMDLLKEKNINAEILKIKDIKNRKGIFGFLKSGYEATFEKSPQISYDNINFEKYDLFFIISPIWAGRLSSPMRTFLIEKGKLLKSVAFVSDAFRENKKIFEDMEKLTNFPKATLFINRNEINSSLIRDRILEFLNNVLSKN